VQLALDGQLQLAPVQASFPTSLLQATDNTSSGSRRKIFITQLYQFLLQEMLSPTGTWSANERGCAFFSCRGA